MQKTRITDQSPVIRLPDSHHRRAKAWAALNGLSLRDAMCVLIDQAWGTCPDLERRANPEPETAAA